VNTITGQTSGVTLKGATYEITWERSGKVVDYIRPAFYLCVEPGDRETREEDHVLRHCSALPCTHCNSSLGNVGSRK